MGNCGGAMGNHAGYPTPNKNPVMPSSSSQRLPSLNSVSSESENLEAQVCTVELSQVIPKVRGSVHDNYQLEASKQLGSGTYGVVARATQRASGAARAIKKVRHGSIKSIKALHEEITTMQAMDHPNVIKLYEAYEDLNMSHLVMELCEGGELLDKIIAARYFSENQAAIVMQQILRAVRYVHDKDIAHRDLKPQNFLLLTQDKLEKNTLKLIDFGFACPCKPGTVLRTRAGTALYVAPQVLQGRYDKQCDLWSAGVTLYALLSGRPPFPGRCDQEIFEKVKKGRFSLEGNNWRRVSSDAKDLICQLLKINPATRLTAEQALQHVWVTRKAPSTRKAPLDKQLVERLQGFRVRNKLERAVLKIIARHLSEEKVKDLRAAFEALDANGDGALTKEELGSGLTRAGFNGLDLRFMMAMADANGNGLIDYTEFLAATLDRSRYLTDDALLAAFQVFDRNGDGSICERELRQVLYSSTQDMESSCQRVMEILSDHDISGDGGLDFDEFKDMMHSWTSTGSPPRPAREREAAAAALGGA